MNLIPIPTLRADDPKVNLALQKIVASVQSILTSLSFLDGWHPVTFLNSWKNYGSGVDEAAYTADIFGRVYLRGLVARGVAGYGTNVPIFALPSKYSPKKAKYFFVLVNPNQGGRLDIEPNGNVSLSAVPSFADPNPEVFVSLESVSFDTRG